MGAMGSDPGGIGRKQHSSAGSARNFFHASGPEVKRRSGVHFARSDPVRTATSPSSRRPLRGNVAPQPPFGEVDRTMAGRRCSRNATVM